MLAKVYTAALLGLDANVVEVEVDIQKGLHKFNIVGLAGKAVQEAKERVTAAIKNSTSDFISRKITVNLAPADLPKSGPGYDIPIAIGILLASGQVNFDPSKKLFIGELALNGKLRSVNGLLSISAAAQKAGFEEIFVPETNADEASLIKGISVFPVKCLDELVEHFNTSPLCRRKHTARLNKKAVNYSYDFKDIKGQQRAKRALEIAAAGGHNILLTGTPGSGKTLMAKTLPSILPHLTMNESLEVTRVHSIAGTLPSHTPLLHTRPFRSPHHNSSEAALVGGGSFPKPGEISLAHRGVLFLDEFPEFSRESLEALRQPLEDKIVRISRVNASLEFPANFMLVAAMNPCKCGWRGDPDKECSCSHHDYQRYQRKVSGPILDRIDLQINVPKVKYEELTSEEATENSTQIQKRVQNARNIQLHRFEQQEIVSNSELRQKDIKTNIVLDNLTKELLKKAVDKLNLSARSYFRILRVSRTIADLDVEERVKKAHVAEALSYRLEGE